MEKEKLVNTDQKNAGEKKTSAGRSRLLVDLVQLFSVLAVFFAVFFLATTTLDNSFSYWIDSSNSVQVLSGDWENNADTETVTFDRKVFLNEGDTLLFQNYKQCVRVYADGKLIYQVNEQGDDAPLRATGGNVVTLPEENAFCELKIEISDFQNGDARIPEIIQGSAYGVLFYLLSENMLTVVSLIILLVFDLVLLVVLIILALKKSLDMRLLMLFLFGLLVILWALLDSPLGLYTGLNVLLVAYIDYFAFMLMPAPIIVYAWLSTNKRHNMMMFFALLTLLNLIIESILSGLHVVQLQNMVIVNHVLILSEITATLICLIVDIRNGEENEIMQNDLKGFILLPVFCVSTIASYWLLPTGSYRNILSVGLCIFYLYLLIIVIRNMLRRERNRRMEEEKLRLLARAAMIDVLTGLENRRAFAQKLEEIDRIEEEGRNAVMLMMDLNGLKAINDEFGHSYGDDLIAAAGNMIRETFEGQGSCYRIGGDEFAVILPDQAAVADNLLEGLDSKVETYNEAAQYKLSLSRGSSTYLKPDGTRRTASAWKQDADVNLYINKAAVRKESLLKMSEEQQSLLDSIVAMVEAKDLYTAEHSVRVGLLSSMIARLLGFSSETVLQFQMAGYLHDIGKVGIPDRILLKHSQLTEQEFDIMKDHSRLGGNIVSKAAHMDSVANIITHHHEHYDGSGYPSGLAGDEIPVGARVVAFADYIDALTSERVYRRALSFEECRKMIEENIGTLFDPAIAAIVLDNWGKVENILTKYPKHGLSMSASHAEQDPEPIIFQGG